MRDAAVNLELGRGPVGCDGPYDDVEASYQAREFALVGAFRKRYGDEALALAKHANYEAGYRAGTRAIELFKPDRRDLPTAVAMKDRWLGGRPAAEVSSSLAVYRNASTCSKWSLWQQAGLPIAVGCDYNGAWAEGFFQAINPKIRHVRKSWRARGDRICEEAYELVGA